MRAMRASSTPAHQKPKAAQARRAQVVPFSPSAGLLQWVEETLPMMEWLTGDNRLSGGHARYARPGDYTFVQCQQAILNSSRPALRKTYDDVSPSHQAGATRWLGDLFPWQSYGMRTLA